MHHPSFSFRDFALSYFTYGCSPFYFHHLDSSSFSLFFFSSLFYTMAVQLDPASQLSFERKSLVISTCGGDAHFAFYQGLSRDCQRRFFWSAIPTMDLSCSRSRPRHPSSIVYDLMQDVLSLTLRSKYKVTHTQCACMNANADNLLLSSTYSSDPAAF